jgi:hypothetical protein
MTTISATPPMPFRLQEEALALASAVALTTAFTAAYMVIAPFILLGALVGGPVWAALLLAREG